MKIDCVIFQAVSYQRLLKIGRSGSLLGTQDKGVGLGGQMQRKGFYT